MEKGVWQEFDGYEKVVEAIEISREYGLNYLHDVDSAQQYIDRLHPSRIRLKVLDIIERTPQAKTIRFGAAAGYLPPFQAGQYIALFLESGGIRTSRPYSISSPPNQIGYYDLTIKRVPGGLASGYLLDELRVGDELESSGPEGRFFFNPLIHDKTMVCLAGGSGVTPFASMIREVVERGLDREIHLFYGNKTLEEALFHSLLKDLSDRFPNVNYHPVLEDPPDGFAGDKGFITGDLILNKIGSIQGKTFFLCGPQGLYDFCHGELSALGVAARKIKREVYGPPAAVTEQPGWPAEIKADDSFTIELVDGPSFSAPAGQPLILALEKSGFKSPPSLCRSGECSYCRVRMTSGKVFQPEGALVRSSDRKFGWIHSCVSYPLSDLKIAL